MTAQPGPATARPSGPLVVWARRDRPAVDGAPLRLPGVVTVDLPDDWVQVAWPGVVGWVELDAVYERSSFDEVDEAEFRRAEEEARASGWPGVERPPPPPPRTRFTVGERVRWAGPLPGDAGWDPHAGEWQRSALGGVPTRDHPGTVVETGPFQAARVRWVDRDGDFEGRRAIREDWLAPAAEEEHRAAAERLLASDWPGLAHGS